MLNFMLFKLYLIKKSYYLKAWRTTWIRVYRYKTYLYFTLEGKFLLDNALLRQKQCLIPGANIARRGYLFYFFQHDKFQIYGKTVRVIIRWTLTYVSSRVYYWYSVTFASSHIGSSNIPFSIYQYNDCFWCLSS